MSGSSLRIVVPALLVIVGSVPVSLPAHAADGTIVVQRQVQPRVAYRPSMILTGSALPGFASQPANPATVQAVGDLGTTHGAGGGAGAGLAGQINGSLKQGLAPLQMLGSGQ